MALSFRHGASPTLLGEIECNGIEDHPLNCSHSEVNIQDCPSLRDAGVVCGGKSALQEHSIRNCCDSTFDMANCLQNYKGRPHFTICLRYCSGKHCLLSCSYFWYKCHYQHSDIQYNADSHYFNNTDIQYFNSTDIQSFNNTAKCVSYPSAYGHHSQ